MTKREKGVLSSASFGRHQWSRYEMCGQLPVFMDHVSRDDVDKTTKKICKKKRFLLDMEAEHYPLKRISKKTSLCQISFFLEDPC